MHTHHPVGRRPQWAGAQELAVCGLLLPGGPLLPGQGVRPGAAWGGKARKVYVGLTPLPRRMWDSLACSLKPTPAHVLRVLLKSQQ